jgi:hypothetical protein
MLFESLEKRDAALVSDPLHYVPYVIRFPRRSAKNENRPSAIGSESYLNARPPHLRPRRFPRGRFSISTFLHALLEGLLQAPVRRPRLAIR